MKTCHLKDDFGAVGDGVADDTAPVQNWINTAQLCGGNAVAPVGKYKTGPVFATNSFRMIGEGYASVNTYPIANNATVFLPTANLLKYTAATPFVMENIQVNYPPGPCSYTAIEIDAPTGLINQDSVLRDVFVINANIGVSAVRCARFNWDHIVMEACQGFSVYVRNLTNADGGDQTITNSVFSGQPSGGHIVYCSGGGLKISNCKMNGGNCAIYCMPDPGALAGFGDFFVTGCSIEGCTYGIIFQRSPPPHGTFGTICITGNEIGATQIGIWARDDGGGNWLQLVSATGNVLIGPTGMRWEIGNGIIATGNSFLGSAAANRIIVGAGVVNSVFAANTGL